MHVRQVIPRDSIPSIDAPRFADEYPWSGDDEVIVVDAEPARAYPLRILDYHEIVNDEVGRIDAAGFDAADDAESIPIAVTWCPLCASAVVYDRRVDGRPLTFGVSGKLADDDLVMYDRETESEWKQSAGEAIAGELAGDRLDVLPATTLTARRFAAEYPDGVVLQPVEDGESEAAGDGDDPEPIDYDERPYGGYFSSDGFGLAAHRGEGGREWEREDIEAKTVVLGLEIGEEAVGVPLPSVEAAGGVLELAVGGTDVVVVADDGLHAFEHPGGDVEVDEEGRLVADGTTWDGATGESADGSELERVPARRLFAFAWQDDHGPEAFYEP
ncbi:DUF3179 domain-containing protein [Halovivax sp.]|uniref:DUF3179 domain-containing protein n=1 Tax=Halovivax sp. TaxID=1935978 RepID=UPI0025BD3A9E|nr:DUF3179 domain-containing protein [Halovivax sp.]